MQNQINLANESKLRETQQPKMENQDHPSFNGILRRNKYISIFIFLYRTIQDRFYILCQKKKKIVLFDMFNYLNVKLCITFTELIRL